MKMRNHDHIKGEKGENLIISQDKKLHKSAKSWSFFKKLGSFELLMVWAAQNWYYLLILINFRPFYKQITLCASYQDRGCSQFRQNMLVLDCYILVFAIGIPSQPTLSNIAVMISSYYYKSCIIAFLITLHIIKQIQTFIINKT